MNEKQFMQDVYDVLRGNTKYITQEKFDEKYGEYFVEIDCENGEILLRDEHNEYVLSLRKTWSDGENA